MSFLLNARTNVRVELKLLSVISKSGHLSPSRWEIPAVKVIVVSLHVARKSLLPWHEARGGRNLYSYHSAKKRW